MLWYLEISDNKERLFSADRSPWLTLVVRFEALSPSTESTVHMVSLDVKRTPICLRLFNSTGSLLSFISVI